jgi:hypothetical protein
VHPADGYELGCEAGWFRGLFDDGERADGFQAPADDAHITRLNDPASWLPASAWADREIKAFVPTEYDIYIQPATGGWPTAVQELISAKRWECQISVFGGTYCYTPFTTDEARALAEALDAAGFEADLAQNALAYPDPGTDDHDQTFDADHLQYHPPTSAGARSEYVDFYARLPQSVGDGPHVGPGP